MADTQSVNEGGCYCGNVRYSFTDGDYRVVNCYCRMCQKAQAAPFVPWVMIPASSFQYLGKIQATFDSSGHGTRHFCPNCGTHVAFTTTNEPDFIDVTVCSLDDPGRYVPKIAIHEESKLPWLAQYENG